MISSWEDEIPDETFIAIDDKIATKLFRFFMLGYKGGR
jgi:hypothetical protein